MFISPFHETYKFFNSLRGKITLTSRYNVFLTDTGFRYDGEIEDAQKFWNTLLVYGVILKVKMYFIRF